MKKLLKYLGMEQENFLEKLQLIAVILVDGIFLLMDYSMFRLKKLIY